MQRSSSLKPGPALLVLLLPLLASAWLSCQHTQLGEGPGDRYTLVSVDGRDVPTTVDHAGQTMTVYAGEFFVGADERCASRITFGPPSSDDKVVRKVNCT